MDTLFLAHLQFALTIMFHYIFPTLTIGMGVVLVYLEGRYLHTDDRAYHDAARFWTKIFALNFAIGVASGIVMEFQFGTNWAAYSRFVGDVFGSALAAEGIFAFFLESGFLAVLVFGWDRVSKGMHFFSTCMVALGSIFSSIWIVVANSWQQTPAGHHIVPVLRDGKPWILNGQQVLRAEITSFWEMVFNPSSVIRLTHVLIGCFIMGAFFIMSVSAWYILRGRYRGFAKRSFTGALLLGTIASWAALMSGDIQAKKVYDHQPAKLAAFEGHFQTGRGDLTLFGFPDEEQGVIKGQVAIPGALSFLLHHDFTTPVLGLNQFRPEDRPPVTVPFISWRLMVGIGMLFIGLTTLACILLWRKKLFSQRWLMWIFVFAVIPAVVANEIGWVAAEVGRQPWTVQPPLVLDVEGQPVLDEQGFVKYDRTSGLRTDASLSPSVGANQVLASIIGFGFIYGLLALLWLFILNDKIQHGPEGFAEKEEDEGFLEAAAGQKRMVES